jgi:hypothetical protein
MDRDELAEARPDVHFRIVRVRWPDGREHYGVRAADTEATVRTKLRLAVRCGDRSPLARAARHWGVENAEVTFVGTHGEEARALEVANGLIAGLPAHRRLNMRRLSPNHRRRVAARALSRDGPTGPPDD